MLYQYYIFKCLLNAAVNLCKKQYRYDNKYAYEPAVKSACMLLQAAASGLLA